MVSGETIEIENQTFTVMAILAPLQPMLGGIAPVFDLPLIISADSFHKIWPDTNLRKYYFNVAEEDLETTSELLTKYQRDFAPGMNITSRQTIIEQYMAETRSQAVIGYAISIVIALVGILNFVNSMVTVVISRRKEFAMIQRIFVSFFVVGVLVRGLVADGYSTFHFTLLALVLCTPILILLALLIPYFCFKNLEK